MTSEDKMEEIVSYSIREIMLGGGHWSHHVMLVMICQGSITVFCTALCASKCHVAFNIHLLAPLDLASPVLEVEPYILLIYTT